MPCSKTHPSSQPTSQTVKDIKTELFFPELSLNNTVDSDDSDSHNSLDALGLPDFHCSVEKKYGSPFSRSPIVSQITMPFDWNLATGDVNGSKNFNLSDGLAGQSSTVMNDTYPTEAGFANRWSSVQNSLDINGTPLVHNATCMGEQYGTNFINAYHSASGFQYSLLPFAAPEVQNPAYSTSLFDEEVNYFNVNTYLTSPPNPQPISTNTHDYFESPFSRFLGGEAEIDAHNQLTGKVESASYVSIDPRRLDVNGYAAHDETAAYDMDQYCDTSQGSPSRALSPTPTSPHIAIMSMGCLSGRSASTTLQTTPPFSRLPSGIALNIAAPSYINDEQATVSDTKPPLIGVEASASAQASRKRTVDEIGIDMATQHPRSTTQSSMKTHSRSVKRSRIATRAEDTASSHIGTSALAVDPALDRTSGNSEVSGHGGQPSTDPASEFAPGATTGPGKSPPKTKSHEEKPKPLYEKDGLTEEEALVAAANMGSECSILSKNWMFHPRRSGCVDGLGAGLERLPVGLRMLTGILRIYTSSSEGRPATFAGSRAV